MYFSILLFISTFLASNIEALYHSRVKDAFLNRNTVNVPLFSGTIQENGNVTSRQNNLDIQSPNVATGSFLPSFKTDDLSDSLFEENNEELVGDETNLHNNDSFATTEQNNFQDLQNSLHLPKENAQDHRNSPHPLKEDDNDSQDTSPQPKEEVQEKKEDTTPLEEDKTKSCDSALLHSPCAVPEGKEETPVSTPRNDKSPLVGDSQEPKTDALSCQDSGEDLCEGNISHFSLIEKPLLDTVMKTHAVQFIPYQENKELCSNVLDHMTQDPISSSKAYLLFNILMSVSSYGDKEQQHITRADKEVYVALDELYQKAISTLHFEYTVNTATGNVSSIGPVTYFDRLAECIAEEKTGRTLYQKFIELGWVKSFQSVFSKSILSQETNSGYIPSLSLDKEGNTILHLAASSGCITVLDDVLDRHASQLLGFRSGSSTKGFYWILSCLNHKNNKGQTVLDMTKTPGSRLRLKRTYRTLVHFLRRIHVGSEKTPPLTPLVNP